MKIAYILDTFPALSETFLAREIAALRRRGVKIEVWALHASDGAREISQPLAFKFQKNRWELVAKRLARQNANYWAQIDHIHAGWASIPAEIARFLAQETRKSWSFFAHARDLWVESGDLSAKLKSASFAASCTRAGVAQLENLNSTRVFYAPHGLEIADYPWREWQPSGKPKLLGVGRLVEKKGWPDAILSAKNLGFSLEIIGDGPLRSQLASHAILRGALEHENVIEAMKKADCLIFPSRKTSNGDRDGLANVVLEAAALGLPIVTTNAGSAGDFVDETTGILTEANDLGALQNGIARVFSDVLATQNRCRAARNRVESDFDVNKNIEILAALFHGATH